MFVAVYLLRLVLSRTRKRFVATRLLDLAVVVLPPAPPAPPAGPGAGPSGC